MSTFPSSDELDDLEDLVVGHFEGSLTADQERELAAKISSSEDAKQLFLSYMRMEGRLHSLGRDGLLRDPDQALVEPQEAKTAHISRRTNRSSIVS